MHRGRLRDKERTKIGVMDHQAINQCKYIDGLVQERRNSSTLCISFSNPSI